MQREAVTSIPGVLEPRDDIKRALSVAIRAGPWVFMSGWVARDERGGAAKEALVDQAFPYFESGIKKQTRYTLDLEGRVLKGLGLSFQDVVWSLGYLVHGRDILGAREVVQSKFGIPPATHFTASLSELMNPSLLIEVDLISIDPKSGAKKEIISNERDPFPAAIRAAGLAITSSVITDSLHANVKRQTKEVLDRLQATVKRAGSSLDGTVKAYLHVSDLRDLPYVEEVWKEYFPKDPPARTILQAELRENAAVEVSLICATEGTKKQTINTPHAPRPTVHQPQAVKAAGLLFFSGQMATDYTTGVPVEADIDSKFPFYGSRIKRETSYIAENIKAICEAAGSKRENVIKRVCFHRDLMEFNSHREEWEPYFPVPPTSSTFQSKGPFIVPDCRVMLDLTAVVPD